MDPLLESPLNELVELLQGRLDIIADTRLAKQDPAAHLNKLKSTSEAIFGLQQQLKGKIPPQLEHFLDHSSYNKALAFTKGLLRED
jgi:hypothetical protein